MRKQISLTDKETGQRFIVRLVAIGDKYGRNHCLTNTDEPLVEFYLAPKGVYRVNSKHSQVSFFYADTIAEIVAAGRGMCLHVGHASQPRIDIGDEAIKKAYQTLMSQEG